MTENKIVIPSWFKGKPENYDPNYKKQPKTVELTTVETKRFNKDGIEVPSWFKGKPENYDPNYKKQPKPVEPTPVQTAVEETKAEINELKDELDGVTLEDEESDEEEFEDEEDIDYSYETDCGTVIVTATHFTATKCGIDGQEYSGVYFEAEKYEEDEGVAALLFYMGCVEKHGKSTYKYYYVGEEVVFFTTNEEILEMEYCDTGFRAYTATQYYDLPSLAISPRVETSEKSEVAFEQ